MDRSAYRDNPLLSEVEKLEKENESLKSLNADFKDQIKKLKEAPKTLSSGEFYARAFRYVIGPLWLLVTLLVGILPFFLYYKMHADAAVFMLELAFVFSSVFIVAITMENMN